MHDEIPAISAAAAMAERRRVDVERREWCKRMMWNELVDRRAALGEVVSRGLQG